MSNETNNRASNREIETFYGAPRIVFFDSDRDRYSSTFIVLSDINNALDESISIAKSEEIQTATQSTSEQIPSITATKVTNVQNAEADNRISDLPVSGNEILSLRERQRLYRDDERRERRERNEATNTRRRNRSIFPSLF